MNLLDLISGAGNLLDLPGSSVRDLLSGRNPFDQWTTPFSSDNRASGRDMLSPILGANKETGMSGWLSDPMEGLKDIAGFGAEVITDPMNLIPAGWFGKVLGSRKATQAANAAVKAERGGKYSFVNPKLLARTADDAVKPVVQAVSDQNPMKLLGYTPPTRSFESIKHRMDYAADLRRKESEIWAGVPDDAGPEELQSVYDRMDNLQGEIGTVDPTYRDTVAEYYSSHVVGKTQDEWMQEVIPKFQSLQTTLLGIDMMQPDNQMMLRNLGSAFSSNNPFALDSPLMNTLKQFTGDIADVDSMVVDPLYSAMSLSPRFKDSLRKIATDVGEKFDPEDFDNFAPELLHEGPGHRQKEVMRRLRDEIPKIIQEENGGSATPYLQQMLNVSNLFEDPVKAAKGEYDRLIAKFSATPGTQAQTRLNPVALIHQIEQPFQRAAVADSQLMSDQNPMKLLGYTPPPETVYHGGWDWSASATPEHPYGMFDVSKMHTGEGITVRGPGGYVADEVATTKRYKAMAQGRMDDQFYASPDAMENYFKVGDTLPPQTTNGVPSEVVNFEKQGDRWAVAERDKAWSDQAGDFVSDPRAPLRWHSTRPDMKLLKQKLGENPMQSKTYTLDMPAGSKEKFMGWEDNVVGQPQAVQGLLAADPKLKGVVENVNKLSEARSTLDSLLQAERGFLEEVKQSAGLYSTEDAWHALTQKGAGNARGAHWSLNNQESVAKFADIRSRALGARAEYEALREKLTGEMGLRPGTLNGQDPSNSIRGENLFEMLTGRSAADAGFEDVAALRDSGIPGMRSLANSTGKSSHNYAVWDTDLINQMRVRAIDGQRVPINPTTLVQRVEQPFQRAAVADSQLMSNMNPMNLQRPQTAANPVALALLQNLLSRSNNWAGGNQ